MSTPFDRRLRLFALLALAAFAALGCDCGGTSGGDGDPDGSARADGGDGSTDEDSSVSTPRPDIHVVITADNAYGFGYGRQASLDHYFMGVEDGGNDIFVCSDACDEETPCPDVTGEPIECDIFGTCNDDRKGPETYVVPGEETVAGGFLYIVTWSDELVTQGLIAQFSATNGAPPIYTGRSSEWRVCATGENYDPGSGGPELEVINEFIGKCNDGDPEETFSAGWVGTTPNEARQALVILHPDDEEDHNFDILCGRDPSESDRGDAIDPDARWIWFDDDVDDDLTAFRSEPGDLDPRGDFLIFRLPLFAVVGPG